MLKVLQLFDSTKNSKLQSTLKVVRYSTDIAELVEDWVGLARHVPHHSMSQTAEFAGIAFDLATRQEKECFIITVRHAGALVGIWSLVRRKRGIHHLLEPFSCGTHEEMSSPLLDPGFAEEAARELVKLALSIKADRICFYNLPRQGAVDQEIQRICYCPRVDFEQSYLIDRDVFPDWNAVESQLTKSFSAQLKRYEKKLSEKGDVEFGWSRAAEDATLIFDFIYETKRNWLKSRGLKSHWLNKEEVREFFKELFQRPGFGKDPIITWIKLNGSPIAGGICISTEDYVEALVAAFNPDFSDVACGHLLQKYEIAMSLATRRSYDIGLGAASHKERWAATPQFFTSRIVMRSLIGMIPTRPEANRMIRRFRGMLTGFLNPGMHRKFSRGSNPLKHACFPLTGRPV